MTDATDTARKQQQRLDTDQTFALAAWLREHKDDAVLRQSRPKVAAAASEALGFPVVVPALERVAGSTHVNVTIGKPPKAPHPDLFDIDERLEGVEARVDMIVAREGDVLQRLARLEAALLPAEPVDTETARWKLEQRHGAETVESVQRRIDNILLADHTEES